MKAFKHLLRNLSGAECAMAAAVVLVLVTMAANAGLRSTSIPGGSPCCDRAGFGDYRGPRA